MAHLHRPGSQNDRLSSLFIKGSLRWSCPDRYREGSSNRFFFFFPHNLTLMLMVRQPLQSCPACWTECLAYPSKQTRSWGGPRPPPTPAWLRQEPQLLTFLRRGGSVHQTHVPPPRPNGHHSRGYPITSCFSQFGMRTYPMYLRRGGRSRCSGNQWCQMAEGTQLSHQNRATRPATDPDNEDLRAMPNLNDVKKRNQFLSPAYVV